ncbi:MAG TPA: tRNA-uridine aminocarboxypropyltransferase [Polyangiaceae bacterium]|nr:tRNA-uridine aminocarboxypropyltransferase [Polyangiaceae bacterium]
MKATAKPLTHTSDEAPDARATCYSCFRPEALCCCASLPRLANRTRVVIVQHPRERFHPVGTARLVIGSLAKGELVTGPLRTLGQQVARLGLSERTALLFPSDDARALEEIPAEEQPDTVVVLDGTWHCAKTLLRNVPELMALPRVKFTPEQPSNYRIRREPKDTYLSTLESVALVLGRVEPELEVGQLHEIFREMIDRNIAARRPSEVTSRTRVRGRGREYRPPDDLFAPLDEVAIVYGETVRPPRDGVAANTPREALVVGVLLPDSGQSLSVLLRSDGVLPVRLGHLGIDAAQYEARAVDQQTARSRLETFLGSRRLVAFHPSSLDLFGALGVERAAWSLKGSYCDAARAQGDSRERWGSLDDILTREGLAGDWQAQPDRSERRLRGTALLFSHLRARWSGA